ncbi:uncharacterized protein LOC101856241 isoform X1 [Aplysia californica]|uniref:Uncharacterized protein LOC101856241 isoform X1 n=2 Tax=Aplysia californica TaxID=6500 RepID=A0ABM0JEZ0_APLCA|nr:uncharacterized protein LOC101856241 isoform X1 [Aplysia californica]
MSFRPLSPPHSGALSEFNLMQHLIDEMDKSNQRIEDISQTHEELGLHVDGHPSSSHQYELLYDEAWKSEESDGASLQEIPLSIINKELNDSGCDEAVNSAITEVSKDFLSGLKASNYNVDSDESRISSDTEFKLLNGMASYARYPETGTGLSDTDWNPYGTESDSNASPRMHNSDNKIVDAKTISFNPPLHSTDLNIITPMSASGNARLSTSHSYTDSANTVVCLKPDMTTDFSTISHMSEQTPSPVKLNKEYRRDTDLNQTMRGPELDLQARDRHMSGPTSHLGLKSSGSSDRNTENLQYMSVMERAKLMGIPQEIVEGRMIEKSSLQPVNGIGLKKDDNRNAQSSKRSGYRSDEDHLGKRVEKVLSQTEYLEAVSNAHKSANVDYNMLQKDLQEIQDSLHRTLGPETTANKSNASARDEVDGRMPVLSDNDGDIIPSTTTTPERRKNKMTWDFAADLGYVDPGGLMGEISLDTYTSNSHRPSTEKQSYNSDGDETRTSGSSSKLDDHAAADQVLADMSEILLPTTHQLQSSKDVDEVLSSFRDQRRQLESRYEQLNNQGLADKVYRILTNQDPNSQARGILSDVSAEEKNMKTRYALGLQKNDFNFVSGSGNLDDSNHTVTFPDDVRKRLDLSGLSSVDSSRVFEKSSFAMPPVKGFTAFEDMTKFLSSQMAKVSERTFNHSLELQVPPQTIQCYPLFRDEDRGNKDNDKPTEEQVATSPEGDTEATSIVGRPRSPLQAEDRVESSTQLKDLYSDPDQGNNSNQSPNDSDSGAGHLTREKYRPYRPAGSKEVYYTESDTASVTDSVTTMESTHIGSDDARGPSLPSNVLGSRRDAPNVAGIYGAKKPLSTVQENSELPTIQEKSGIDEREQESPSWKGDRSSEARSATVPGNGPRSQGISSRPETSSDRGRDKEYSAAQKTSKPRTDKDDGISINVHTEIREPKSGPSPSVEAARRNARWENREEERQRSGSNPSHGVGNGGQSFGGQDHTRGEFRVPDRTKDQSPDSDFKYIGLREPYTLPSDAFISSRESPLQEVDDQPSEPLSLRIQMKYEDTNESNAYDRQRWAEPTTMKQSRIPEDFLPTAASSRPFLGSDRRSRFDNDEVGQYSSLPRRRSPSPHRYSPEQLTQVRPRSHSDDNLYSPVRQARLSPAFRRALSPDLRNAIEGRSPLLSRDLKDSLAQPPSYYPEHRPMRERDLARSLSPPPTFLARDRSSSPRLHRTENLFARPSSPPSLRSRSHEDRAHSPILRVRDDVAVRQSSPSPSRRILADPDRSHREQGQSRQKKAAVSSPKRFVELTLEGMSSESEVDTDLDREPVSKRAQLLRHALHQNHEPDVRPDINALWEQFKAVNESFDSSMNSSRMEAVADLLRNPTQHMVQQYLKERDQYRVERQERAQQDRDRRLQEQKKLHQSRHSSSEDDLNGSYAQILASKEEERQKRRATKKKKGKSGEVGKVQGQVETGKVRGESAQDALNPENVPDSLFSIPEDASFEQSPTKSNSPSKAQKAKPHRQQHIIDPNMKKLRDRISKQKGKIDKSTLRELQRIDKLKKLESLLSAKQKGEISDGTLEMQLEEISSTSPVSDNSQDGTRDINNGHNSSALSDDSTTAKDSSAEMHRWKAEKEKRIKEMKAAERERLREIKQLKVAKDRSNMESRHNQFKSGGRQANGQMSEIKLLQLVTEGLLSPQEAYRLALERASAQGGSSQDEEFVPRNVPNTNMNHNERLHRLYSPYSRDDSFNGNVYRHNGKLKQSPSVSSSLPGEKIQGRFPDGNNTGKRFGATSVEGRSHSSSSRQSRGLVRPNSAAYGSHSRSPNSRERPVISVPESPRSAQQSRQKNRGSSFSPSRYDQSRSPANRHSQSKSPSGRGIAHRPRSLSPSQNLKEKRSNRRAGVAKLRTGSENVRPRRQETPSCGGVAWHIPMNTHPSQWKEPTTGPQRQAERVRDGMPLTECNRQPEVSHGPSLPDENTDTDVEPRADRQGADIWHKWDHPAGIPRQQWAEMVSRDALASKTNHWEVDPLMDRVQYILNKPASDTASEAGQTWREKKPIEKMTLQEAFLARNQTFISSCKERQKRLALSNENRRMQECLRLEREAIFSENDRLMEPNLHAHPYSDNLYQPKRRVLTKQEMKQITLNKYKKLPEVVQKKESDKRADEKKLNRLRARLFNKKVQRDVLRKLVMRQR